MTEARFPYPMLTSIDGGPDDLERLRRQREETVRLGLVKTARDEGVGSLISSFVGCVARMALSAASSPAQGLSGRRGGDPEDDDGEEEEWIRSTTAQNFAAVVESTGIKLPLDPAKGIRFETVDLGGVGCGDSERVEWFRRHRYVAEELFPHLSTEARRAGTSPPPPTLEELLDAGLRLEHLIDRDFVSPACFRGFVEHYRFGADKFGRVFGVRTAEQWRSLNLTPEEVRLLKEHRVAAQVKSALASPSRSPAPPLSKETAPTRTHAVSVAPASASSASASPARGVGAGTASRSRTPAPTSAPMTAHAPAPRAAAPYRQESPSLKPRPVLLEASAWSTPPPKTPSFLPKPAHHARSSISPSPRASVPAKSASAW